MRTERLLACVAMLGLFAGSSYAIQPGETGRVDSKAQSENGRSGGMENKVAFSIEAEGSGKEDSPVTSAMHAVGASKSNKVSAEQPEATEDVVRIAGKDQHQTHECKGRSFVIVGTSNTVKLTGECKTLNVAGKSNQVDVETVAAIRLSGNDNRVTWERGVNNKPPSIEQGGKNNIVSRKSN